MVEFELIYKRLGINLTERGESFYHHMMKSIVDNLEAKGRWTNHLQC